MVSSVIFARVAFALLGLLQTAGLIYTCLTDGSPFRTDILTPWMNSTLLDFYINVAVIATWVNYKETTWAGRVLWTVLLICLGSITSCFYVVLQLFRLKASDSLWLVLLRDRDARLLSYDAISEGVQKAANSA